MANGIDLADMRLLREEASLIQDLIARLKTQLNRLKIEEMQLASYVRGQDIKMITDSIPNCTNGVIKTEKLDDEHMNTAELNLNVNFSNISSDLPSAEEEEEEEEQISNSVNTESGKGTKIKTDVEEELAYFID